LVKSCIRFNAKLWFKVYYSIVSKITSCSKGIIYFIPGFVLSFCGNVVLADNSSVLQKRELEQFINIVEKANKIPSGLLVAIAKVESDIRPYAINIAGKTVIANDPKEAALVVKDALSRGITNIDIGIVQINYRWHGENFNSVEEMLNPKLNTEYAGRLLAKLFKQHGDWHKAIRFYHSNTPEHHRKYSRKIVLEWLKYV
jgi:soluble lytic murein transglycosylase-like protein